MKFDPKDDTRQALVIAKNEMRKFLRGKKLLIFAIIVIVVTALNTIIPYLLDKPFTDALDVAMNFVGNASLMIEIAAILFTATTLVSEFQERTALILFTRPVRKISIFLGKLIASLVVIAVFTMVYYLYIVILSFVTVGDVNTHLLESFVLALAGIFGLSGLSMLISAIAKKGSTASILTFVVLLLGFGLLSGFLTLGDIDNSWLLTVALNTISGCIANIAVIGGSIVYIEPDVDILYNSAVIIAWGIVCTIAAFLLFRKRDF